MHAALSGLQASRLLSKPGWRCPDVALPCMPEPRPIFVTSIQITELLVRSPPLFVLHKFMADVWRPATGFK